LKNPSGGVRFCDLAAAAVAFCDLWRPRAEGALSDKISVTRDLRSRPKEPTTGMLFASWAIDVAAVSVKGCAITHLMIVPE
jgi:hypothetical protein